MRSSDEIHCISTKSYLIYITYGDPNSRSIPNAQENWTKKRCSQTFWAPHWIVYVSGKQENFSKSKYLSLKSSLCTSVRQLKQLTLGQTQPTGALSELNLTQWICSTMLTEFLSPTLISPIFSHTCPIFDMDVRKSTEIKLDPKLSQRVQKLPWNHYGCKWCRRQSCWILSTSLTDCFL